MCFGGCCVCISRSGNRLASQLNWPKQQLTKCPQARQWSLCQLTHRSGLLYESAGNVAEGASKVSDDFLWRSGHNRNTCNLPLSIPGCIRGFSSWYKRRQQEQHQSPENLIKNLPGRLVPSRGHSQMSLSLSVFHSVSLSFLKVTYTHTYRYVPRRKWHTLDTWKDTPVHNCTYAQTTRVAGAQNSWERFLFLTNSRQLPLKSNWGSF